MRVHAIESEPFAENSYVVWTEGSGEAFVIDPGYEPDLILDFLRANNLGLAAIVCTHGHVDHIAGNTALKAAHPAAAILIGHGDAAMLTSARLNLSVLFGEPVTSPPADRLVADGDALTIAGIPLEVFEIPGHSPGHVVYLVRDADPMIVLGGDVLFAGSVGRTDFPGGSFEQLAAGIRAKLWLLPDTTQVFPGHGPPTTIGEERRTNPFVGEAAG
ncbi:MAG TPA: MBL fold metallo-hydrolase [Fimbriiglobus sp.]|nr:MBL fold metallo-hydrolase [Fimbriiglobus sp.]